MNYSMLIKMLRDKLILTQTEFANLLNVSYITVCRWENGVYEPTTKMKRKIVQLCKENNVNMEGGF